MKTDNVALRRELYSTLLKLQEAASRHDLSDAKKLNDKFDSLYGTIFAIRGDYTEEAKNYDRARNNFLGYLTSSLDSKVNKNMFDRFRQEAVKYLRKIKKP